MYFDKYKCEKIDFEKVAFFFAPDCIFSKDDRYTSYATANAIPFVVYSRIL